MHIGSASIIVCPHAYLCDPLNLTLLTHRLQSSCMLVVDEAHNMNAIMKSCCAMSVSLDDIKLVKHNMDELKKMLDDKKVNDCELENLHRFKNEHFCFNKLSQYCNTFLESKRVEAITKDIDKVAAQMINAADKIVSTLRVCHQVRDEKWEGLFVWVRLISIVAQMSSDVCLAYNEEEKVLTLTLISQYGMLRRPVMVNLANVSAYAKVGSQISSSVRRRFALVHVWNRYFSMHF